MNLILANAPIAILPCNRASPASFSAATMGGCASKPKDLYGQNLEELPSPTVPEVKPAKGDASTETKVEETKVEPLLVDLSADPKPNELVPETKIDELRLDAPMGVKKDVEEENNVKHEEKVAVAAEEDQAAAKLAVAEKVEEVPPEKN